LLRRRSRFHTLVLLFAPIHRSAWNRNSANFAITEFSEVHTVRRAPAPYREGRQRYHVVEDLGAARRSEGVMRFIVGILWIILMVFIILVVLNIPGIR
jgi:hypothetical protein